MTDAELQRILSANPDLQVEGAEMGRNHSGPVSTAKLSERELQAAVIAECDKRAATIAEYGLIFTIPNGQYRQGQRVEPGLRAGVPDLAIMVARHGYNGAFIELKRTPNRPTEKQAEWMDKLERQGYICKVFYDDPDEVIRWIEWYLCG